MLKNVPNLLQKDCSMNARIHLTATLLLACLCCSFCLAAEPTASAREEILTNNSVLELRKLGFGDPVIIEKIRISLCKFDLSLPGMKQLKEAGVSDAVIQAMQATIGGAASTQQPNTVRSVPAGDPNDPKAPHASGIWLYQEVGGKGKMTKLEATVFAERINEPLVPPYKNVARSRGILRGTRAALQIEDTQPTFYFFFEEAQAGFGRVDTSLTSPSQFTLAVMDVDEKKNRRRLVVGKNHAFGGFRVGVEEKDVREVQYEQVQPGVYRVTPKQKLGGGEYCFTYAGAAGIWGIVIGPYGVEKVFDFGIRGPASLLPTQSKQGQARRQK